LHEFLGRSGFTLDEIEDFACHPGGAKVLDALEQTLGLAPGGLSDSRLVLRDYGNMSAVTVLFVLKRMCLRGSLGRTLLTALGPGFSAAFLVLAP
jgi:alkylresorcinol/alkylpyrone synthase